MDELKQILDAVAGGPTGVTQFTIDWAEDKAHKILDREEGLEEVAPENDWLGALAYDVDNILEIMKPDLPDVLFFERIQRVARQLFV